MHVGPIRGEPLPARLAVAPHVQRVCISPYLRVPCSAAAGVSVLRQQQGVTRVETVSPPWSLRHSLARWRRACQI